jgi:hypothetical protein
MDREIALFPLNLVTFSGEKLNLHIFEPRYKQLINDCLELNTSFGIPSYIFNKIEYGTEVFIDEVTKIYDDGRMDIKTIATNQFKVLDFQNPWKDRMYAGGLIEEMSYDEREDKELKLRLVDLLHDLFEWLKIDNELIVDVHSPMSDYVHKVGLKPEEEFELFMIDNEVGRQQFIINHLKKILPALERAEKARQKISLNGHFKHFDPLKF